MASRILSYQPAAWPGLPAPGISHGPIPSHIARTVKDALRAVDLDIERHGAVSAETVDKVRAARILLETPL